MESVTIDRWASVAVAQTWYHVWVVTEHKLALACIIAMFATVLFSELFLKQNVTFCENL